MQVPVSSLTWPLTCVTNPLPTATTAAMTDSSYSGSDDEAPAQTLESLFESSGDDDAAPPAPAPQEDDDDQLPVPDVQRTTPDEPAPEAVPAEPDGHVNADGVLYREPRRPFTGTLWDALRNAFIRIDVDNRRLPTGGRPQGYIWVPSINGFRRTLAQTLLDEQRLAEQLRNAQQPRRSGQAQELFGPDVPNATLLEISWYVSACGHH